MDKKLKKNTLINGLTQFIEYLAPLLIAPYVSRIFDVSMLGSYSYSASLTSYFVLIAGLGLASYGTRMVAQERNDKTKLSKLFWELTLIRMSSLFISLVGYFLLSFFYIPYRSLLLILSLNIFAIFFDISWFYQGLENFSIIACANFIAKCLLLLLTFLLVKTTNDLLLYVLLTSLFGLLPGVFYWFLLPRYLVAIPFKDLNIKRHLRFIADLFVPTIAISVYTVLDKTMIGFITNDDAQNGFYDRAYKIVTIGTGLSTIISPVFFPRISAINDDEIKKKELLHRALTLIFFVTFPLCSGMLFCAKEFIPLFFGPGYEGSIVILETFSFLPLIVSMSNFVSRLYFLPSLMTRHGMFITIFGALINICLNFILIPRYGAEGAAIGTVISETLITCLHLFFYFQKYGFSDFVKSIWKYCIAAILMSLSMFFSGLIPVSSEALFFIKGSIGVFTYCFSLLILHEELLLSFFRQVHHFFIFKKNKT